LGYVVPPWIGGFYQTYLLVSQPPLELLLPLDRGPNAVGLLVVDEAVEVVPLGEPFEYAVLARMYT